MLGNVVDKNGVIKEIRGDRNGFSHGEQSTMVGSLPNFFLTWLFPLSWGGGLIVNALLSRLASTCLFRNPNGRYHGAFSFELLCSHSSLQA